MEGVSEMATPSVVMQTYPLFTKMEKKRRKLVYNRYLAFPFSLILL